MKTLSFRHQVVTNLSDDLSRYLINNKVYDLFIDLCDRKYSVESYKEIIDIIVNRLDPMRIFYLAWVTDKYDHTLTYWLELYYDFAKQYPNYCEEWKQKTENSESAWVLL